MGWPDAAVHIVDSITLTVVIVVAVWCLFQYFNRY